MSLVNNLLLLYYFVLFAAVVFIVPWTEFPTLGEEIVFESWPS